MPSQKAISSQLPATQANCMLITIVLQTPCRHTPASAISNSITVLKELEQLEILPIFTILSLDYLLYIYLTPFFTAIRKLISDDPTPATYISYKFEKIESLISYIDKKIQL